MRITSEGQVTIPADIRAKAGLLPDTEVEFEFDGTAVRLFASKVQPEGQGTESRGARLIAHLRRTGGGTMTTDEIMAMTRGE